MMILAFRIPEVRGMVESLFGVSKGAQLKEHETHLRFLMVCYSAPLMLTGIAGIIYYVTNLIRQRGSNAAIVDDEDSFA